MSVFDRSIGQAMQAAAAATLESIAAQCLTLAIYALGWGFLDLAQQNYPGATAAFQAAAIYGVIGGAAAVTGRAIAPSQGGSGSGSGAAAGSGSGNGSSSGTLAPQSSPAAAAQQPYIQINVAGHVIGPSGAAQLCDIINQAVYANDVKLYASHAPNGVALG